jgi:hypothetical protein
MFAAGAAMMLCSTQARAQQLSFNFDTVFGANSTTPTNPAPWVNASFKNVTGGVLLTITNVSLYGAEFLDTAYFNLATNLQATSLTFTLQSTNGLFALPTISKFSQGQDVNGSGGNKADGDGYFDIVLSFAMNSGSSTFDANESVSYLISGISGLNATNFDTYSQDGNSSQFLAAAHVQNVDGSNSKSAFEAPGTGEIVPVPEPARAGLLAIGIGAWAMLALPRHRKGKDINRPFVRASK